MYLVVTAATLSPTQKSHWFSGSCCFSGSLQIVRMGKAKGEEQRKEVKMSLIWWKMHINSMHPHFHPSWLKHTFLLPFIVLVLCCHH